MFQFNLLPLNTEAELIEDWVFEYKYDYWNQPDLIDVLGTYIDRDVNGNITYGATATVVVPAGTKFLIRKYDLNQGNINGRITVTIRILGRSPKVKVEIPELNKLKYILP
jgi:hypothetical protein